MRPEFVVPDQPTGPNTRQTGYWLDNQGAYYEGDRQPNSIAVPRRPSAVHEWAGTTWALNTRRAAQATIDQLEQQQSLRLTPRAMREFILGVMATTGFSGTPAFAALRAIDDEIRAQRGNL